MKIENVVLISIPIIASLSLLVSFDTDSFGFDGANDYAITEKAAVVREYQTSYDEELEVLFELYEEIYQQELANYQQKIEAVWGEFVSSTEQRWVSYIENDNIRRIVDYETGSVSVEIQLPDSAMVPGNVIANLEKHMVKLLNSTEKAIFETDQVAMKVEARLPIDNPMIKRGNPSENFLFDLTRLSSVAFNHSGMMKVSSKSDNIAKTDISKAKVPNKIIVASSLLLDKEILQKASQYTERVQQFSVQQKIPAALVFAIMESESNFNPLAKSHIPAFGIMQIVPKSAGRDATKHLYGKAKILAPSYLYSTDNNINIGSAYLHVLYYKYLDGIKNPQSRIYCAIAAYNTGASNVAKAFVDKQNFDLAVTRINRMTPDEVFQVLVKQLPYMETRRYLKKVTKNMDKYLLAHNTHGVAS